jgi:hypothetical protein
VTTRHLPLLDPETLPPRLAGWAARLLDGPIPRETHATCATCAMASGDPDGDERTSFDPDLKCCTYLPELPNFTVGAILSSADAAAREPVRRRIAGRASVTPLGVGQPPQRVDEAAPPGVFGRDPALLCAHYAGGQCSIWAHRDSVCATYFCKFQRGGVGLRFWTALRAALATSERALARRCLLDLGLQPSAMAALGRLPSTLSVLPAVAMDAAVYAQIWGGWEGREEAFFLEAARAADGITWDDIERAGGAELAIRAEAARHEYRTLVRPTLPERPVARSILIRPSGSDVTEVAAYSAIDPIALPPLVVAALGHFDGRPLADALAAARARERVGISEELVQTLADFGVIGDREE